jgi:S-adenosyl methyltransferase
VNNEYTTVLQADVREPGDVLARDEVRGQLDFSRPIGVIASAVLHHMLDETMRAAFDRGTWRTDEQIAQYFEGTTLVDPGIVPCALWRPDKDPGELSVYQRLIVAGLGKK